METRQPSTYASLFAKVLSERTLILDGGMGTMLQKHGTIVGPAEWLNITDPERVKSVHRAYIDAGADIITTNTFSAHAVSLSEYDAKYSAEELAFAGAQLARKVVDECSEGDKVRFVAGSVGPTNRSLTLDAEAVRPTFDKMVEAYQEQIRGLIRGGVDVVLIETIFDLMNAKAAVEGAKRAMDEISKHVDLWLSFTLADAYGRTLTGYNIEDCIKAMSYARPTLISLNCGFGPDALLPYAERISTLSSVRVGLYPNAGLPDAQGNYTLSPEHFAEQLTPILQTGTLSVVGGCCGTTDEHIKALKGVLQGEDCTNSKSLPSDVTPVNTDDSSVKFQIVGERCNIAGSRLFCTMVAEGRYEDATNLALKQLASGASVIDINVDAPMLNGAQEMLNILDAFSSEAKLIGVPLMIDSSDWNVVTQALNRISGKLIVNSISLKDGEEVFLYKARTVATYGAGLVVMAADENGQATDYEHRMRVCKRAYRLLREQLDFPAEDIIFDPNVLAICTGVKEHMNYASDLLKTIKSLHDLFPHSHIIGGLSNLSFAFRGCEPLRRALHSVFLHHARLVGMDMVILNPSGIIDINEIPNELKTLLEDAILRSKDVTSELMEWGAILKSESIAKQPQTKVIENTSPVKRLQNAILKGQSQTLEADISTLLEKYSPLEIITHHLMQAMEKVGDLFGSGQIFLPQVIRSAEMMSRIVALLQPYMATSSVASQQTKVILATVKGDVHDIGKNICATLLRCNGFEVIDLGVMVEAQTIVKATLCHQPAFVGLSGLITPSLAEMKNVIEAFNESNIRVPILIGGATTSFEHTALHLAPSYKHPVLWTQDASQLVILAKKLYTVDEATNESVYSSYVNQLCQQQIEYRNSLNEDCTLRSLADSRKARVEFY